jgi:dTMP kinase
LIDRSPLSLLAYQVYAEGFAEEIAYPAVEAALQAIAPTALICLQASVETLTKHKMQRDNSDHFERQSLDFHQKVIDGYAAAEKRIQVTMVDAEGTVDEVYARIMATINPLLPSKQA